ncbi:Two component transcriptional regulator, LuxR family [Candidatus Hydrogenisulfobacillus filiaventi]|uniref:Stage 0 sporulation protein A homolog n=1 Tax=Candidatus Hydrogenisulfobacillus filiaventi TaxID=2707344 RepID=A0A6F8ZEW1_9FIRM|nr:response regulator transcription factor [Bacillota bacterium]CAB1128285.1 Two component transcriptional regulator, LuxR family [Candidatus Hydrogenisulfobacillus filiaventi]
MIRVLLVEDQYLVRDALARLLEAEADLTVTGQAATLGEARTLLATVAAEVALVDIQLPDGSGLDLLAGVRRPGAPALAFLTTFARPGYIRRALEGGARGFLLKNRPVAELAARIRDLARGETVVDPELVRLALAAGQPPLAARELEVLAALDAAGEGADTRLVARSLGIAPGTLRNHISTILAKLGLRTRAQALAWAREQGWI